jgi:hypothetical protein
MKPQSKEKNLVHAAPKPLPPSWGYLCSYARCGALAYA